MYRLVLYYLMGLIGVAFIFSFFGLVPTSPFYLIFSTLLILIVCLLVNEIFSRIFHAPKNAESAYITALILALIISAPSSLHDGGYFSLAIWASIWAMASKYIFAIQKKHIWNPAAFGVVLTALVISQSASWWVGTLYMVPFVLFGGLLLVRKLRRIDAVVSFLVVSTLVIISSHALTWTGIAMTFSQLFLYSPLLFFSFVMLTEPLTMPPGRKMRILYGSLVGFLFLPSLHIGSLYFTPELALIFGNIFSYLVSPKGKYVMKLKSRNEVARGVYDFVFTPDRKLRFAAGQYLEWTLPHKNIDLRGNRRYFTIASSPGDEDVYLGIKMYPEGSSFKHALMALPPGQIISAGNLAGDFILPKDRSKKITFIAGGIGITPYLSMIQDVINKNEKRDIVLFYSNKTRSDIAYEDFFVDAEKKINLKTFFALTEENPGGKYIGKISSTTIMEKLPDFKERIFYLSGPEAMVRGFSQTLRDSGVPKRNIKKDFFPGFA